MGKDYYKILGVEKGTPKDEIKKAYKKLAKKYHPDISKEADAETKFKEINEAAGILLDDAKKQQYDTYGSANGPQGFGGGGGGFSGGGFNPRDFGINIDDIFEQFGFGGGGRQTRSKQRKDTSISSEIEITLDDVYFGVEKEIKINREIKCSVCSGKGAKNSSDVHTCSTCSGQGFVITTKQSFLGMVRAQNTCPDCRGEGKTIKNPCSNCNGLGSEPIKENVTIKVPKGVESGVTLRVSGKGSYDKDIDSYGDLYLKVYVKKSETYEVDDADLYRGIEINFVQAILGDEVEFKHFDKTLSVKIPEGTQSSTILRLKGKGLPHFNYNGNGDLYIKINVEIPTKVTKEQKNILHEYAKTFKDKNLLDRMKGLFK